MINAIFVSYCLPDINHQDLTNTLTYARIPPYYDQLNNPIIKQRTAGLKKAEGSTVLVS